MRVFRSVPLGLLFYFTLGDKNRALKHVSRYCDDGRYESETNK